MNNVLVAVLVLAAIGAAIFMQMFLDGFIAFIPFLAIGLIALFWGFRAVRG